jgi:serine/threonine protein phosphatase PrpC
MAGVDGAPEQKKLEPESKPESESTIPSPADDLPYKIVADSAAMQGRRPKQEDRHVKIPDLSRAAQALKMPIAHLQQPCALFAVYDGHRGTLCSEWVAKQFHLRLLRRLTALPDEEARICVAMREVCEELDAEFLAKYRTAVDGSTLVAVLVSGTRLFTAWLGDSRALLARHSGSAGGLICVALTKDHSAESECERIKAAGGVVVDFGGIYRVAHQGYEERIKEIRRAHAQGLGTIAKEPIALAVSRSLGDRDFKDPAKLLLGTPDVRCVKIDSSSRFFALLCDGVTEVMRNEEVTDLLREKLKDVRGACGALVQEAYNRGSGDNLTALVVRLDWVGATPLVQAPQSEVVPKESAAAASKRRRLAMADQVKAQKMAAWEREQAAGGFSVDATLPAPAPAPAVASNGAAKVDASGKEMVDPTEAMVDPTEAIVDPTEAIVDPTDPAEAVVKDKPDAGNKPAENKEPEEEEGTFI